MEANDFQSSYIRPNIASLTIRHAEGAQTGETSGIKEMDGVFKWMRGFINGWYGWSNDGKGTFFDFMAVMKAKRDGWKFALFKQEDMNSSKEDKRTIISADDVYDNLIWSLTGITPFKHFADLHKIPQLSLDKYHEALEFIEEHFFVVYPHDRRYQNIFDEFKFLYEKYKIDCFLIDPFKALILDDGERGDERLTKVFIAAKEFSLETNSSVNFINHAKSMMDQKEKDGPNKGRFKIVNQFMQLGGSAWDINMDSQYSIYRPERHLDATDPKVNFWNLKQRKAEIVGCNKGVYENIKFDFLKKQFYFNGINPMDGSMTKEMKEKMTSQNPFDFSTAKKEEEVPF